MQCGIAGGVTGVVTGVVTGPDATHLDPEQLAVPLK